MLFVKSFPPIQLSRVEIQILLHGFFLKLLNHFPTLKIKILYMNLFAFNFVQPGPPYTLYLNYVSRLNCFPISKYPLRKT